MEYHKFLHNEDELDIFLTKLREVITLTRDECFYLMLMSRNKYLTEEERKKTDLGRANIVTRQILHSLETKDVIQALRKMECAYGAYTDRSGNPIPNECLIPYLTYNPVSPIKAFSDTQRCFVEYLLELDNRTGDKSNTYDRLSKIDSQYRTQLQHAFSRKVLLDFDFDIPEGASRVVLEFTDRLTQNGAKSFVVKTRGGFHVLVERATIKYNYTKDLQEIRDLMTTIYGPGKKDAETKPIWEIEANHNEGLPLAGCLQKDYLVRLYS